VWNFFANVSLDKENRLVLLCQIARYNLFMEEVLKGLEQVAKPNAAGTPESQSQDLANTPVGGKVPKLIAQLRNLDPEHVETKAKAFVGTGAPKAVDLESSDEGSDSHEEAASQQTPKAPKRKKAHMAAPRIVAGKKVWVGMTVKVQGQHTKHWTITEETTRHVTVKRGDQSMKVLKTDTRAL
jgi:hypothetical protein